MTFNEKIRIQLGMDIEVDRLTQSLKLFNECQEPIQKAIIRNDGDCPKDYTPDEYRIFLRGKIFGAAKLDTYVCREELKFKED